MSMGYDAFMASMEELRLQLESDREDMAQAKAQAQRALAKVNEEQATKRRSGELGHAWQVLQQRIDMKQTCENDIFGGIDKSPEAREVRQTLAENVMKFKRSMAQDPDNEAAEAVDELHETIEALREQEAEFLK